MNHAEDPGVGPARRTYAEALADAELDMALYGSICVIRDGHGMFQRISPTLVSVRVGELPGYSIASCGRRPAEAPAHDWSECHLPAGHDGPHAFIERGTRPSGPSPWVRQRRKRRRR